MYHAAGWQATRGCTERVNDLLQLIALASEVRGEDRVRQLADIRRKPVVCVSSEAIFSTQRSLLSERTRAGTEVDRYAFGIEAISHELRTFIAVESPPKSCLYLRAVGPHAYREYHILVMVVLL